MKRFVSIAAAGAAMAVLSAAQSTTINGGRMIRGVWDASSAVATKPAKTGAVLPASCETGEAFFKTDAEPGRNLYLCTAAGVWSEISGGASHTQNTDTGTTSPAFQLDSGGSGPKIKNNAGTLEVRNAADDAYAPVKASYFEATGTGDWTPGEAGTSNLGSATLPFAEIYVSGTSGTPAANNFKITGISTGGMRTVTLPDGDATVPTNALLGAVKARTCEIHIWGTGSSGVLQDIDDEPVSCYNGTGAPLTISEVRCWANDGSPTVLPIVTGGAANSILSGALTCGTGTWATGTLNGTPALASGSTIDANIGTAGGVATSIRLIIRMSL